jgi:hypothetical protein
MQGPWFAIGFVLYLLHFVAAANPGQVEATSLAVVLAVAACARRHLA